jgi:hypothetical protein
MGPAVVIGSAKPVWILMMTNHERAAARISVE